MSTSNPTTTAQDQPLVPSGDAPRKRGNAHKDPVSGKFLPGNKAGKGNVFAGRCNQWKDIVLKAISKKDLLEVVDKLIEQAKQGEKWAVVELLDRVLGKPETSSTIQANVQQTLNTEEAERAIRTFFGLN